MKVFLALLGIGFFGFLGYMLFGGEGIIVGIIVGIIIIAQTGKKKDDKGNFLDQTKNNKRNKSFRHVDNTRKKYSQNSQKSSRSSNKQKSIQKKDYNKISPNIKVEKKSKDSQNKTSKKNVHKSNSGKNISSSNNKLSINEIIEDTSSDINNIAEETRESHENFFKKVSQEINSDVKEMNKDFKTDFKETVEEKTETFEDWLSKRKKDNKENMEKIRVENSQQEPKKDVTGLYKEIKNLENQLKRNTKLKNTDQKLITNGEEKTETSTNQVELFEPVEEKNTSKSRTETEFGVNMDYFASDTLKKALDKSSDIDLINSDSISINRKMHFDSDILSRLEKMGELSAIRSDIIRKLIEGFDKFEEEMEEHEYERSDLIRKFNQ